MQAGSTLGGRLASARKRRGLSQRELAQASGLSVSLIRKIEQGEREDTRLETASESSPPQVADVSARKMSRP